VTERPAFAEPRDLVCPAWAGNDNRALQTIHRRSNVPFPIPRPESPLESYARRTRLEPVRIPRDELAHEHEIEWWYFSGHLREENGDRWTSFMLSMIRGQQWSIAPAATVALFKRIDHETGPRPLLESGHAFSRAYSESENPVRFTFRYEATASNLWLASWSAVGRPGSYEISLDDDEGRPRMRLTLRDSRRPILLGTDGVVDYGSGHRMAYFARPSLEAMGTAEIAGRVTQVRGSAWLERQWGPTPNDAFAWKYLNVTLEDGERWLVYRSRVGSTERLHATCIPAEDAPFELSPDAIEIEDFSVDGASVGTRLALRRSTGSSTFEVVPLFPTEPPIASNYPGVPEFWESVSRVTGERGGRTVGGWAMTEILE
jgi:hypothetical protein